MDLNTVGEQINAFLDNLRLGTIIALAGIVVTIVAYCTGDISIEEAFAFFGISAASGTGVGVMRTYSGKGLH